MRWRLTSSRRACSSRTSTSSRAISPPDCVKLLAFFRLRRQQALAPRLPPPSSASLRVRQRFERDRQFLLARLEFAQRLQTLPRGAVPVAVVAERRPLRVQRGDLRAQVGWRRLRRPASRGAASSRARTA